MPFYLRSSVLVLLLSCIHGAFAQSQVADARALLADQQNRLGSTPGTLLLDHPAHLEGEITLAPGHNLRITAPLTVGKATVHLAGHNQVRCEAPIDVENATDLFVADGATDISVRDCDITVHGQPGGYLLTATRAARVTATDNHLVNMAIFNTHNAGGPQNQTTDVTLTGNSTELHGNTRLIGIYLLYVIRGVIANNRFMGTGHGIQWWGGDGNLGWHGADDVTRAGNLAITGNQCFDPGGACVWGSMGFDITVSGNEAQNCGDVCFDAEGGVRNLFTGNVARGCAAGCYSVQMESVDITFTGNFAYADAKLPTSALFLIKHHNENPAPQANLTVTGNTMSCANLCQALYTEGEDGFDFSHNTITNGFIQFANYTHSVTVRDNTFHFTTPLAGHSAIAGPSVAGGHTSVIAGNTLLYEGPGDAGAGCISQSWSDDNNSDEMRITGNTCIGFAAGINTETAGHNNGAPTATWVINDNQFSRIASDKALLHKKTSGNERYLAQGPEQP